MNWRGRRQLIISMLKKRQFAELKKLVLRRLYINFIWRPVGFPLAIIIIPLLYFIEPFKRIRVGVIPTARIGHLTIEPELFLRRKKKGAAPFNQSNVETFFVTSRAVHKYEIANKQLLKMFKRNLRIFESYFASGVFFSIEWLLRKTRFVFGLPHDENFDSDDILQNSDTTLILTKEEEEKGNEFLRQIGFDVEKDWFACIFARDSVYLDKNFLNFDWSYHNWRDADIDTFIPAAEHIINNGGYAFRVGSCVEKKMAFQHERFIDYAVRYRSDFLDIFLVAKCKFFLGTTSGICDVATAMNKPRIVTNCVPLGYVVQGKDCIYIPKKIKNKSTGEYLSMSEALQKGMDSQFEGNIFLGDEYEYQNNTSQEILEVTKEMMARLNGAFQIKEEDKRLMEKYYDLFKPKNMSYKIKNPPGLHFIRNYREVFFD